MTREVVYRCMRAAVERFGEAVCLEAWEANALAGGPASQRGLVEGLRGRVPDGDLQRFVGHQNRRAAGHRLRSRLQQAADREGTTLEAVLQQCWRRPNATALTPRIGRLS